MSQTKYKMSPNIRSAVVNMCREYQSDLEWLKAERSKVWSLSNASGGQAKGNHISHQTEDKALRLQVISQSPQFKRVHAIDQARNCIGDDLQNDELVRKLQTAIWESALDARHYPYEVWDLPTIYRDNFYERKRKFLLHIAINMNMV